MSLQDALTAVERHLTELIRSVARLEEQVGTGLDMRRVRSDANHLRESLGLLKESATGAKAARPGAGDEMVPIPDAPYDAKLWTDAEDEGLGAKDRHAP
ncbi:hypothetical protein [Streptomyces gilvosporeus]|uniref:Uncharacterized protein n=1 Tax=Streptomyces gilvosporeus TaxID=553510 RepID=A0A1V0TX06_9ACTN|nr:hypothetical protein [Streptomyces gilvosporeus]ARF57222.1 hypothetical protein B1H19_26370 [Streptomyces gilvosporeus]